MNPGAALSPRPSPGRAFTLIEVTLALGIAGFCLVTLFALLPLGLTSNQASLEQTMAGNISSAILGDLRCGQPSAPDISPRFGLSIPAAGAAASTQTLYLASSGSATGVNGTPVMSGSAISRYRATVQFYPPQLVAGQPASPRTATAVRVLITWPAFADPVPGTSPTNYTGSYEAATTLNCN